jgi:hypothetical protein
MRHDGSCNAQLANCRTLYHISRWNRCQVKSKHVMRSPFCYLPFYTKCRQQRWVKNQHLRCEYEKRTFNATVSKNRAYQQKLLGSWVWVPACLPVKVVHSPSISVLRDGRRIKINVDLSEGWKHVGLLQYGVGLYIFYKGVLLWFCIPCWWSLCSFSPDQICCKADHTSGASSIIRLKQIFPCVSLNIYHVENCLK